MELRKSRRGFRCNACNGLPCYLFTSQYYARRQVPMPVSTKFCLLLHCFAEPPPRHAMATAPNAAAYTARLTAKDHEHRMSQLMEHGAQHPDHIRMRHPALNSLHSRPHGFPLRECIRAPPLLVPNLPDLLHPATYEFPPRRGE